MGNEDRKALKENVASKLCDNDKEIEIHDGVGEIGIKVFKVAQWKSKCKSYFNRYYKTSSSIVVPSDKDIVMERLCFLCSESKGRWFVFKNYDIIRHLEFLGYAKMPLLGTAAKSRNSSYIAYIEQTNVLFICEKVSKVSSMHQSSKNIATMVKYFLTLYDREIQASGVTVIGLLIIENEKQEEIGKCSFCQLFCLSYKDFESIKDWWNSIVTYEGWWNLANPKKQSQLFKNLAAEILCFMAMQEEGLPTLTEDKSLQFKQTYYFYTPQQMDIHFSDAKHVIIQGSYGSGKSIMGLKKLELIWKTLNKDEKIIYINFDRRSSLHILMEKNVKDYIGISSRKIKRTSDIRDISETLGKLIHVYHNSAGKNLSAILHETMRLNMGTSERIKTNYHLIIEEYDGETLSHDEAAKIKKLVKKDDFVESNIILLAQPLMKNRRWNIGKNSYDMETCLFRDLENTFKIVKLEEVLRCSNKICGIIKSTQRFVGNKDSIFKTKMNKLTFEQRQKPEASSKHMVRTPISKKLSNASDNSSKVDKILDCGMDLDQAFKISTTLKRCNSSKSEIVSKFGFLCEPRQGVDVEGLKPNLVEFSESIHLTSDIAVVSLSLVLKDFIGNNLKTTFLYMADKKPVILRRSVQLLLRLDENFLYTQDIRKYLQKSEQSKMLFCSNFCRVNVMEFDHVIIVVDQSEYYLKYYLPQAISRCTYDLTFVLLPKVKINIKKGSSQKLSHFFSKSRNDETKETVGKMIHDLKREDLLKQMVVTECKACENNCDYFSISNETDDKQTFKVHTHTKQYKDLFPPADYTELEEQAHDTSDSTLADIK